MTIEEKLNEFFYVPEHLKCKEADDEVQIQREAFRDGANWMLEKALCWLKEHADDYAITNENGWGIVYSTIASDMFTEFKKAMDK